MSSQTPLLESNVTDLSLSRCKVTLVTHVRGTGPSNFLEDFLSPRVASLLAVDHPLDHRTASSSVCRVRRGNEIVLEKDKQVQLPGALRYFVDVFLTLRWTLALQPRTDLYIGVDPLNALAGLLLRSVFRRARYVIFYAIDYSPRRFSNSILNSVYHFIERYCASHADETWDVSNAIDAGRSANRRDSRGMWRSRSVVKVVPIGVSDVGPPAQDKRPDTIIFLGHLLEKQGLQLVIEGMPRLLSHRPGLRLVVVGDGPFRRDLEAQAQRLHVEDSIEFRGHVPLHRDVETLLATATIAVAPYLVRDDSFTRYADPGKVKAYLAAGLPIVITGLPSVADELVRAGCGVLVDDDPDSVANGIEVLLADPDLDVRRGQARRFVADLSWSSVFSAALADFAQRSVCTQLAENSTGRHDS